MRKLGPIQKFLILLAFVVMPVVGYLTLGGSTPCQAQTCSSCGSCIYANSLSDAVQAIWGNIVSPALSEADLQIRTYFQLISEKLIDEVNVVYDWITRETASMIDTFWYYNLRPAMQSMTRQLNIANLEQTYALGSFADAVHLIHVKRALEDMAINDQRAGRPSDNVCVAATVTSGMTRTTAFSRAYNAAAPTERLPRSANRVNAAAGAPVLTSSVEDMNERWKVYLSRYCNQNYNNGAAGCTAMQAFADQDIDVAGAVFSKDTIDVTNKETRRSLDDLVTNLAEPFIKDPAAPASAQSMAGQTALLEGQAYKAKRQLVYDSLYHIISRRVPGSPDNPLAPQGSQLKDFIAAIRDGTGELPSTSPNPSRNEVMRALITQRFRNGKYALTQIDEPENNRRQMVIQQALQLMQMNEQLDLMDHYALLLAAEAGQEVRETKGLGTAAGGSAFK